MTLFHCRHKVLQDSDCVQDMFVPILQTTAYRYQVYISLAPYICLYPSNYNIRYLYLISSTKYTHMRTFIPMHTHIYIHARIYPRPRATLSVRSQFTNIGFQYFKEFGLQESRTLRLRFFSIWSWRLSCGVLPQTSLRSHTLILSYSHTAAHQHQWRIIDNNTP